MSVTELSGSSMSGLGPRPLWVKSRHVHCTNPCPLYPRKRTFCPISNMRANGVRTLSVRCGALWCNHDSILDVSDYRDDVPVPAFGPRMVCTICGAIGADAI